MTAAEFKFTNFPTTLAGEGMITLNWASPLTVVLDEGVNAGVSVAFDSPREGPIVSMGNAVILALAGWGNDHVVGVSNHSVTGNLLVVNDEYAPVPVDGWDFIFNCVSAPCDCTVPTESASISSIKALY